MGSSLTSTTVKTRTTVDAWRKSIWPKINVGFTTNRIWMMKRNHFPRLSTRFSQWATSCFPWWWVHSKPWPQSKSPPHARWWHLSSYISSNEVKAKHTTWLADISITLGTSWEEMLTDLVHEYLRHLPEQNNNATYRRLVGNLWCDLELLQTVGKNGLNQASGVDSLLHHDPWWLTTWIDPPLQLLTAHYPPSINHRPKPGIYYTTGKQSRNSDVFLDCYTNHHPNKIVKCKNHSWDLSRRIAHWPLPRIWTPRPSPLQTTLIQEISQWRIPWPSDATNTWCKQPDSIPKCCLHKTTLPWRRDYTPRDNNNYSGTHLCTSFFHHLPPRKWWILAASNSHCQHPNTPWSASQWSAQQRRLTNMSPKSGTYQKKVKNTSFRFWDS